jgi:hypothetical protein
MGVSKWAIFCAGLLLLAVVFSYPLVFHLKNGMPYSFMPVPGFEIQHQQPGDYLQLLYKFWLFENALSGHIPFFTNYYEFSTPLTPPLFSQQGLPLSLIFALFMPFGNIFAYNALILLSFVASGAAIALLLYEFTGSAAAAMLCGFIYSCVPYRLGHLYGGHMGGIVFFLIPLMLYCFEKAWWKSISGGDRSTAFAGGKGVFKWGFACAACALCAVLMDFYMSFFMVALLAVYFIFKTAELTAREGISAAARAARSMFLGLLLPAAVTAGYLIWIKYRLIESSAISGGRTLKNLQAYSPMLRNIFSKSPNAEKNIYLGLAPFLCALYGFFIRRREIRNRRAERGALFWLYFWGGLFVVTYLMSLGTTLEKYLSFYAWLHAHIPLFRYSRTSSRIIYLSFLGLFMLIAYGIRDLLSRGRVAKIAVGVLSILALIDYHPKRAIGISIMHGIDNVYDEVWREAQGKRLLELPIWHGDSFWSSIYEYYVTLTGVRIVNGYTPVPKMNYIRQVFEPLRNLNYGEMRERQYRMLKSWNVPYVVLHQELFPRKVSCYPFQFTLLNLTRSPYVRLAGKEGPHFLFALRDVPAGPEPEFVLRSPVGIIYPAQKMESEVGSCIPDSSASSGFSLCAGRTGEKSGLLMGGNGMIYPTGEFKAFFHLRMDMAPGSGPVARIEIYDLDVKSTLAERLIEPADFSGPHKYQLFELKFAVLEPRRIELRVHYPGSGIVRADFAYMMFSGEEDPCRTIKAEDLFHIGNCLNDPDASSGSAVSVGKEEDPNMSVISGPDRIYGPGRYRARLSIAAREIEEGTVAKFEVASSFGKSIALREMQRDEFVNPGKYQPCEVLFELDRPTPLSFLLWHYNRACLRLDRIEVERIKHP